MSQKQIIFKIIEHKPTIPNISDYNYQIICYDTQFKECIYCNKNNEVIDTTNIKKSLKYVIKLMKSGKILGVGNLIINNDIFNRKIKRKIYNNINLFLTENNYKKIFPQANGNKIKQGIIISMEVFIIYNIQGKEKEKEKGMMYEKRKYSPIQKKIKLIKRNFSFQKNEYSVKSINNYLTTSTSNKNTYNNLNNCYESDNYTESNINFFSSDKLNFINNSNALSPTNISAAFSEPHLKKKKKKIIKKRIISSISFKNNNKKNKTLKKYTNNIKYNLFDLKNKIPLNSSRNKKFEFNKNQINIVMTQGSNSFNSSNTFTQSSIIDSALIENENNINILNNNKKLHINTDLNINSDIFIYNNINKYNKDNDEIDFYLIELENKKNKILNEQLKNNKKLFNLQENENKLINTLQNYDEKIKNNNFIISQIKEKKDLRKYKEEIVYNTNKKITPLISKIKESKEIENHIINLILKSNENIENNNKNKIIENNIQKYNKNLMIKMLKNAIQSNHDIDLYLNDDKKYKLKNICNKYHIFGSIIEDINE